MIDPERYQSTNKCVKKGISYALEKHGHLIKWKKGGQDNIMDVGCGTGNGLIEVILPYFVAKEFHYSKVYGMDITEDMINFCKERYFSFANIQFLQMDIMKKEDIQQFLYKFGALDHIVSSYVLHWVPDQEQALKNIFGMLHPGGDLFTIHIHSTAAFEMYTILDGNEKWDHYFDNLKQFIPLSHSLNQQEEDFNQLMINAGFTDTMVDIVFKKVIIGYDDLMTLMRSVHAQMDRIPEGRRDEYMKDYMEIGVNNQVFREQENGELEFDFNYFVAYGRKPE